jgi:hypothetical protein
MPLITRVEVDNFRCFQKLRVDGLSRVNLFVGKNNSGKTALLEAIEAIVSVENPMPLYRASMERGESRIVRRKGAESETVELEIRHWFHGHRFEEGATFRLRAFGDREFSMSRTVERAGPMLPPPFVPGMFVLTLQRDGRQVDRVGILPLTPDGFLGSGAPLRLMGFSDAGLPVGFVTTHHLLASELALLWEGILLTPREEATVESLRLIDPRIDRTAISATSGTAAARVLLHGATGPIPMGTLGEGVSRIFTLAIYLAKTRGGFLLVDEIENGLHWSVMPKVWRFLVETAQSLDVQVFATTHSKDCIEAIAELHGSDPRLAEEISVHRLEAGKEVPVRFDAGRIAEYVQMELEAR